MHFKTEVCPPQTETRSAICRAMATMPKSVADPIDSIFTAILHAILLLSV
jgi:hypothetical protein